MDEIPKKPSFIVAWLEDLKDDVERYGVRKLVPLWLLIFGAVSSAIAFIIPEKVWDDLGDVLTLYGAVLTMNGLLLALSWSGFGKIYETASAPGFAEFLRATGMLKTVHFFIDFIHYAQLSALGVSGASLLVALHTDLNIIWQRIALALTLTTSLYALRYAIGAVRIMQDLVWYRARYDVLQERKAQGGGNVVPMSSR